MSNSYVIATFVDKRNVLSFMEALRNKFKLNLRYVFMFSIEGNEKEVLVTFRTMEKEKYLKQIVGAELMYAKNGCIFSVGAIEKLLSQTTHEKYLLNWEPYVHKLLLLRNDNLSILAIEKINPFSLFCY
jgi:hypothetical protein